MVYDRGMTGRRGRVAALCAAAMGMFAVPGTAAAATETVSARAAASDGVTLQTTLTGEAPLAPRPVIVEFSPYGRNSGTFDAGPDFNHLLVQIRGTGDSHGSFDALGPRVQQDVADVLAWACHQPWSSGVLGLNGFSASAITVYNSLHLPLPCVKAAVLKSGTFELYRDLLSPGGISNLIPGAAVLGAIGGLTIAQGADRDPATIGDAAAGDLLTGLNVLAHPNLDWWWRERGFRGDVNHLPILMVAGFFDVESRGAFEAYQALKGDGAHLIVTGAHDAAPAGTDGGRATMRRWFDHYLRGAANGVEAEPRVRMWMSDGDRPGYVAGRFVQRDATDWPVPGTRWRAFALDHRKSGTATSLNDGTLSPAAPALPAQRLYPTIASIPTMTDVPNAAILDAGGLSALTTGFPALVDMRLAEPLGLSFTSAPLTEDLVSAGPGSLEVKLATTGLPGPIWAVVSDVSPDGVAHPLTVGRLSTDYPDIDESRSLRDPVSGDIVQPYGRFDVKRAAPLGTARRYRVELWPLGNRFRAGHRIRLHLVGQSLASAPMVPGVNIVTAGGPDASRLLLPVLP
jgi:predicted acyl esterase